MSVPVCSCRPPWRIVHEVEVVDHQDPPAAGLRWRPHLHVVTSSLAPTPSPNGAHYSVVPPPSPPPRPRPLIGDRPMGRRLPTQDLPPPSPRPPLRLHRHDPTPKSLTRRLDHWRRTPPTPRHHPLGELPPATAPYPTACTRWRPSIWQRPMGRRTRAAQAAPLLPITLLPPPCQRRRRRRRAPPRRPVWHCLRRLACQYRRPPSPLPHRARPSR